MTNATMHAKNLREGVNWQYYIPKMILTFSSVWIIAECKHISGSVGWDEYEPAFKSFVILPINM